MELGEVHSVLGGHPPTLSGGEETKGQPLQGGVRLQRFADRLCSFVRYLVFPEVEDLQGGVRLQRDADRRCRRRLESRMLGWSWGKVDMLVQDTVRASMSMISKKRRHMTDAQSSQRYTNLGSSSACNKEEGQGHGDRPHDGERCAF